MKPTPLPKLALRDGLVLLCLGGMWGCTFLLNEIALTRLQPLWIVAMRIGAGFLILVFALGARAKTIAAGWPVWRHFLVVAVLGNAIPWTLVVWAQLTIASSLTAVLYSLMPIMAIGLSALGAVERFTSARLIGLTIATGGTLIVIGGDAGGYGNYIAMIAVLIAVMLLAAGTVYAKRHIAWRMPAISAAAAQLGVALIPVSVSALAWYGVPEVDDLKSQAAVAVLFLGATTGVGFALYYSLIRRVGPTNATMVNYLTPVVGVMAGAVVLEESVEPSLFLGGGLILGGIWLTQRRSIVAWRSVDGG